MAITVTRLTPCFAARIGGADITRPLDEATWSQIRAAFDEHSVLVFGGGAPSCGGRISGPASCSETRQPGASARNGMICGQRSSKCATGSVSYNPAARACRPPLPPQMYQPQMPRSGVMRRALSGCWPSVLSATATLSSGEGGTKGEACAVQISCGLRVSTQCGESTTCPRRELSPGAGTAMTGPPEFIEDWIRA